MVTAAVRKLHNPRMKCRTCKAWMRFTPGGSQLMRAPPPLSSHCVRCAEVEALRAAFEVFKHKGPVDRGGPQRKAALAREKLEWMFSTLERCRLSVAWSHAMTGEGRQEWDALCAEIEARLFPPMWWRGSAWAVPT